MSSRMSFEQLATYENIYEIHTDHLATAHAFVAMKTKTKKVVLVIISLHIIDLLIIGFHVTS